MELTVYRINAFSNELSGGNPACVIPLENWLTDSAMLDIANKNGVSETAFFIIEEHVVKLRWFTPDIEMDLCGHATLATAHCLKAHLNYPNEDICFKTKSGTLNVCFKNGLYELNLPNRVGKPAALPGEIANALNIQPKEVYKARDYLLVYQSQTEIETLKIERSIFDQINIDPGGVIVTAVGKDSDFVSRFFTPQASILEDPVTGSSHCTLIPYWFKRLQKKEMKAKQLSKRGGDIGCIYKGSRVQINGAAFTVSESIIIREFN